jgi:hypothetical protein
VIAYETLTGKLPFPLADDLPHEWQAFFSRSLATDQTLRPKSASEFLARLDEALAKNSNDR